MSDDQLLALLDELHIVETYRDETEKRLMLIIRTDRGETRMTVTEYKNQQKDAIAQLEEDRQEVKENKFAEPVFGEVAMGSGKVMKVQIVKRDDQLNDAETAEKKKRIAAIDTEIRRLKKIIGGMNHLQVHYKELAPRITSRSVFKPSGIPGLAPTKVVWTKGIKTAVILCAAEYKKSRESGKSQLDVCRDFLNRFTIEEETHYTPEQLSNNVTQLLMLDRLD